MNIYLRFSKHCWQYPILVTLHEKARNSCPELFCKKRCIWKFHKPKVFSCEFCEIFHRTPPVSTSEKLKPEAAVRSCSVKKVFLQVLLNLKENTCARVSFLQPWECNFIKIEYLPQVFSSEFCEYLSKNNFLQNASGGCSCKSLNFTNIRLCHGWFFVNFLKLFGTYFDALLEFSKNSQK